MKKLFLISLFLSLFLLNSCSADENCIIEAEPSETEIIAEKLQNLIDDLNVSTATVYVFNGVENSWVTEGTCNGYKVEHPYIQVCGANYHLSKLVKYETSGVLKLYFKY